MHGTDEVQPVLVGKTAAILLASLGKVLPLMQLPQMNQFVANVPQLLIGLSEPVQVEVCGALLCVLLIPVGDPKAVNWEERFQQTKQAFTCLFQPYLKAIRATDFIDRGASSPQGTGSSS